MHYGERRRPRGTGGRSPQKFEVGTAHALVPPIFREVVLSDVCESINRVKNGAFLVRKGSNTTFNLANIGKIWEKQGKIWKKVIRLFCRENGNFFPQNRHSEILGPAKKISDPPNPAPGLRR